MKAAAIEAPSSSLGLSNQVDTVSCKLQYQCMAAAVEAAAAMIGEASRNESGERRQSEAMRQLKEDGQVYCQLNIIIHSWPE